MCGVSFTDLPYVRASVDGCLVKASYKGGLVVVRVERAILRRTADYFLRSVAAGLRPFAGEGVLPAGQGEVSRAGSGYRGSSQDCLSLALWGSGLSVRTLPPSHHFPLQFYEHFRADLAAGGFGPIVHMHYQHLFRDVSPLGAAVLDGPGFPSEGLAWFTSRMAGLAWPPGSGSRA